MNKPVHKIHDGDSHMFLRPILKSVCERHQVADDLQAQLIGEGLKQFSIFTDGTVMPTGSYANVDHFIQKHKHDKPQEGFSVANTKGGLLTKMAAHLKTGNKKEYAVCRKQYSECS